MIFRQLSGKRGPKWVAGKTSMMMLATGREEDAAWFGLLQSLSYDH